MYRAHCAVIFAIAQLSCLPNRRQLSRASCEFHTHRATVDTYYVTQIRSLIFIAFLVFFLPELCIVISYLVFYVYHYTCRRAHCALTVYLRILYTEYSLRQNTRLQRTAVSC